MIFRVFSYNRNLWALCITFITIAKFTYYIDQAKIITILYLLAQNFTKYRGDSPLRLANSISAMHHNIIKIHNNILWDWQYFIEYSPHLVKKPTTMNKNPKKLRPHQGEAEPLGQLSSS